MSKFTENEREQIRQCLLTKGKELFIRYGFAKTSIDDIVQACGIGKGSFYKFFSSKEELFYYIVNGQEEVRNRLIVEHLQENLPPREMISSFFYLALRLADENPLLQQWFDEGEHERIVRKLPAHLIKDTTRDNVKTGIQFIQSLIERGVLKENDPEVIAGVFAAILMLRTLKERLGHELFPKIMDVIIDCIAQGLTGPEK
ncbi:TetR/AcrR family transcriptional regulator [Pelotomaculum propionicicum]|uniref:Putative HTH-type transcriptional regulator n=1 Tax=Pelotomaculum propionicicum TaxID=258475 RepID=A0A4Y7RDQ6_9FIRM|nr:TetR/AcrR family transcriptional regulator [Pelotomaculum propionicicum]NLI13540.1 TetR/AcrR family transcriptional regulator [Peptococcaceae bacterium]TEB06467.1 putative HTH-type transcriptional regulator [Pelotomaculum propionicicum]